MSATATYRRILVLAAGHEIPDALQDRFGPSADFECVESLEAAQQRLRETNFELVIADPSYIEMMWAPGDTNANLRLLLETIGQGVCIFDANGALQWDNPRMRSYPRDLIDRISEACKRTFRDHVKEFANSTPAHARARRFSLVAGDDQHFDVTVTPVVEESGRMARFSAVVWDVTHSRRLQQKIDAIDLAGRELVRLDAESTAGMDVEERLRLLERKILRYLHDLLHFDNFAVLLVDKKTNRLEMVLQHGMCEESRDLDIYASTENNGISGYVAATGRSYICHDTASDPRYLQGLEQAKSSLTVPLRLHDRIIGVLDIESDRAAAFNEDDRQFAEMLARYVALALNMLDLLIVERYESTGQLADDVIDEIAGPLNDIVTEAGTLVEEFIGNDELRHRLHAIIDSVDSIKKKVRTVASPRCGILGRHGDMTEKDPLLEGKRILIADDEETIRETIGGVLRGRGCDVTLAKDGAEAIGFLESQSYDMLLADIKMPHRNGYEVFAASREIHPDISVILMTGFGYDPNHSIVRARQEGLNAVLFKPFKVDQLMTEIRSAFQPAE
ncbi:MAG TPA: response regulator [Phycisphaerae bacterium]|nr:response regulator [Phycisphaerae bacterium]HRW54795.1 response regulator [Phycisphaerae bacterium]